MKLKEQILRQQEQQMLYMGKFLDYIYDNVVSKDFTSDELEQMQNSFNKPINNKDYKPKRNNEMVVHGK